MSLPNYMFIGAAKSATTTFFDMLKNHSEIFTPHFKEPHFFNIEENYLKGIDWYKKTYFSSVNSEKVILEFTPTYFYFSECAERIYKSLGSEVKFVVILRNPVDRAYSHYNHSLRDGHEGLSFEQAIKLENSRLKKYKYENNLLDIMRHSYISQGLYHKMLSAYLKYFDFNNFLIINFNSEVVQNIDVAVKKLSDFFEIDLSTIDLNIHSNKSGKAKSKIIKDLTLKNNFLRKILKFIIPQKNRQIIRNRIKNYNKDEYKYTPLSEEEKNLYYNSYFSDDILKLEQLVGKKMNWNSL
tara:strand:+ start:1274 stop:2164 length:891 start_codon:yes stop_codon:yes gene_type:complete